MFVRAQMDSELTHVTGAVRDHLSGMPEDQRDKKIGKQNWGTFETNSQRVKNQTVEESMAEIDRFVAQGRTDDGREIKPSDAPGPQTKLGNELKSMLSRNGIKAEIKNYSVEGGTFQGGARAAKTTTEITETRYEMEGEKKDGLIAFNAKFKVPPGSGTADSFLDQYKAAEAAKYKPGYANRNPNGVN